MSIDLHSHVIPRNTVDAIRSGDSRYQARVEVRDGGEWMVHDRGYAYPLPDRFYDPAVKLADMARMGLNRAVLSPAPTFYLYWLEPETAAELIREVNDGICALTDQESDRLAAMVGVPLQEPDLAVAELRRVGSRTGVVAVEIGSSVEEESLDQPKFRPFFALAEELDMPVFLHPYYVGPKSGFQKYYFTNLLGNPLDTAIGAASLIFGGVLDDFPRLRVILAHGGGFLPYQVGRLDHGYRVRPESRTCRHEPSGYLRRFYYDSITFNQEALSFLVRLVGSDRVVVGSDYPFDMGPPRPTEIIAGATGDRAAADRVSRLNVAQLFPRLCWGRGTGR